MSGTGLMVGWAKPVPFNEHNLHAPFGLPRKYAEALVAAAGLATNIALAILGAVLLRTFILDLAPGLAPIAIAFIVSNLGLAILNMLPIPPLDGSKVVASILPPHLERQYRQLEQYAYMLGPIGLILVLYIVVTFLSPVLSQAVQFLFDILMGR